MNNVTRNIDRLSVLSVLCGVFTALLLPRIWHTDFIGIVTPRGRSVFLNWEKTCQEIGCLVFAAGILSLVLRRLFAREK